MAGERGLYFPELPASSLKGLPMEIQRGNVSKGFSNSRTCEIVLSLHGGIPFQSLFYLIDKCTSSLPDGIQREQ